MKRIAAMVAVGLATTLGCGGGDGGGPPDRSAFGQCYGDGTMECTGVDQYEECLTDACRVNYQACLGSGFATGNFSGACGAYMDCIVECPCDDQACASGCAGSLQGACMTCLTGELATCVTTSGCAAPDCSGGSLAECERLSDCCATLAIGDQPSCTTFVDMANNGVCMVTLETYQAGGMCAGI